MKPSQVRIDPLGMVGDTLGRAETEMAAAVLVRYYVEHGDAWGPVTPRQVADWLEQDAVVRRWFENPFFQPDAPAALVTRGLVTGWRDADDPGEPTARFRELLTSPGSWRRQGAVA